MYEILTIVFGVGLVALLWINMDMDKELLKCKVGLQVREALLSGLVTELEKRDLPYEEIFSAAVRKFEDKPLERLR